MKKLEHGVRQQVTGNSMTSLQSRAWLSSVHTAGVEPKVHVDINLKVDHKLTAATLHLPVEQQVMPHGKVTGQMRAALRLPEIREAL